MRQEKKEAEHKIKRDMERYAKWRKQQKSSRQEREIVKLKREKRKQELLAKQKTV